MFQMKPKSSVGSYAMEGMFEATERTARNILKGARKAFKVTGFNMTDDANAGNNLLHLIVPMLFIMLVVEWIGIGFFVLDNLDKSFPFYADPVAILFQSMISACKMISLLFSKRKVYRLVRAAERNEVLRSFDLSLLDDDSKREIQLKFEKVLCQSWSEIKKQVNFYTILTLLIVGWYMSSGLVLTAINYITMDVKNIEDLVLELPNKAKIPFFGKISNAFLVYPIDYIFSISLNHVSGIFAIGFESVFITLSEHIGALIQCLLIAVPYATDGSVLRENRTKYLKSCIRLYEDIYKFFNEVNNIFYLVSLAQFFLSLLILCMVLFQASIGLETEMKLFMKMVFYLGAASFQIFLFCYNGQRLNNQSRSVPLTWYQINWMDEPKEFRLCVQMMIMRTNREFVFKVAGFTTMSMETWMSFAQTCFSYFLLLRKVNTAAD